MRILMISDHADPLVEIGSKEAGGQNIYILYLAKSLSKLGIYVDVYTRWDRQNKKQIVKINKYLRIIRVKAGPKRYIPRDEFWNVIDEFTKNVLKITKKGRLKYKLLHSNYWFSGVIGLRLATKLNIPMVHVFHSIGKIRFNTLKKHKVQKKDYSYFQRRMKWEEEIAKKTTSVIATSPVEKQLIKRLFKIPGSKIQMIPIGIEHDLFRPLDMKQARRQLHFSARKKIIVYVGRIEWRKGLGTLFFSLPRILKKHPNTILYVIGGAKNKTAKSLEREECLRLKKMVRELKLQKKVRFLGPRAQSQLYRYYSAADACLVPSYYEPFGIVPLESMACGTPVVASRTGGLKFTIKDGSTGYLAKPRDYRDLADKVTKVLNRGKLYFYENCLRRIEENFLWEDITGEYIKHFNTLIEK